MAFYRCGGGGIPSSLKTDMNAVYNKKFGTSTTYDPSVWASTANLMGPLPERTATGSIAYITDGADDVPLISCKVVLSPSLDGYNSVTVYHTDGQTPPVFSEEYTVNLGRTIYGGTAEVVNGEGSADGAVVTLDDNMSYGISIGSPTNRIGVNFYNSVGKADGTFASNVLTVGENIAGGYKSEPWVIWCSTSAPRMWISVPTTIDTVDKFKQYLSENPITVAYQLATPTDFTFTPITPTPETALGVNNFWADEGDSEVTYRADINLALGGQ